MAFLLAAVFVGCKPQKIVLDDSLGDASADAPADALADVPTDVPTDAPDGKDVTWPSFSDGGGCSGVGRNVTLRSQSAQVLIELDRSTNMQAAFSNTTRIAAVQTALTYAIANYTKRVQFGYEEFPGQGGGPGGGQCSGTCCAGQVAIKPGLNDFILMNTSITCADGRSNCKAVSADSPSHSALEVANDFFRQMDGDRYVLLITSSEPSCSSQDAATVCQLAHDAIRELVNNDVQVSLISVGNQSNGCLSDLANIGSTTLATPNDPNELAKALDNVLSVAAKSACTLTVLAPPSDARPDLYIDQTRVPADGWKYAAGPRNAITLNDPYCKQYLASGEHSLVAYYPTCAE